jgi:hypothetical protein
MKGLPDWIVLRQTIDALVDRGRMKFTDYKVRRGRRFPIAAEVVQQ